MTNEQAEIQQAAREAFQQWASNGPIYTRWGSPTYRERKISIDFHISQSEEEREELDRLNFIVSTALTMPHAQALAELSEERKRIQIVEVDRNNIKNMLLEQMQITDGYRAEVSRLRGALEEIREKAGSGLLASTMRPLMELCSVIGEMAEAALSSPPGQVNGSGKEGD